MKKTILSLMILSVSMMGASWYIPTGNKKYKFFDIENYKWMANNHLTSLSVYTGGDTEKFMTKAAIERYLKLKIRNFDRNLKFTNGSEKNFDYSYFSVYVELFKYNNEMEIYFGLVNLYVSPSINVTGHANKYIYTMAIAGSDTQLKQFIKEDIDTMIEQFAEDTYYMEDLVNTK